METLLKKDIILRQECLNRGANPLDLLRGLAILDMLLVHFSYVFPTILQKFFVYHDVAIDGFILISGYTVGKYSLPIFINQPLSGGKKILIRTIKIYSVHVSLVCTVGLMQFIVNNKNMLPENILVFLTDSLLFKNQVGLLHILPVFILLYLYSPAILSIISNGYGWLVIVVSGLLFFVGTNDPLIFNYGAPTIFPLIVWQVFFIVGIFLGKKDMLHSQLLESSNMFLLLLVFFFVVLLFARHAAFYGGVFYDFLHHFHIEYSKFPLNLTGTLFGASAWFLFSSLCVRYWENIERSPLVLIISIMGKNALFAFFIHVFLAKIIEIYRFIPLFTFVIIAVNIFIYIYFLREIDRWLMKEPDNLLSKVFIWLFQ